MPFQRFTTLHSPRASPRANNDNGFPRSPTVECAPPSVSRYHSRKLSRDRRGGSADVPQRQLSSPRPSFSAASNHSSSSTTFTSLQINESHECRISTRLVQPVTHCDHEICRRGQRGRTHKGRGIWWFSITAHLDC